MSMASGDEYGLRRCPGASFGRSGLEERIVDFAGHHGHGHFLPGQEYCNYPLL